MKQFLDFLPLVVFFAFYKLYDIFAATYALIIATAVVLIYSWIRYRKVEKWRSSLSVWWSYSAGLPRPSTMLNSSNGRLQ